MKLGRYLGRTIFFSWMNVTGDSSTCGAPTFQYQQNQAGVRTKGDLSSITSD